MLPSRRCFSAVIPRRRDNSLSISRTVSWLLRHSAKAEGLNIRPDGFVPVQELVCSHKVVSERTTHSNKILQLRHPRLEKIDFNQLQALVENDKKGRFKLIQTSERDATGTWWIRANQGHTFTVSRCYPSLVLERRVLNVESVSSRSILWTFNP